MFIEVSDDVDPAVLTLDLKENERPAKKDKAEKAKDIEEVATDFNLGLFFSVIFFIMAYTGRLRPKGVPFSGFRYKKGRDFTS